MESESLLMTISYPDFESLTILILPGEQEKRTEARVSKII